MFVLRLLCGEDPGWVDVVIRQVLTPGIAAFEALQLGTTAWAVRSHLALVICGTALTWMLGLALPVLLARGLWPSSR